jgi:predicted phage terminase large subunit-like protein
LLDREVLAEKRRSMGPYVFACQMLQDPRADETQGFREPWIRYYDDMRPEGLTTYILCDPASSKKRSSDFTVMWVVGLGSDKNYYLLDGLRDRLNLTERAERLMGLHRKWRPKQVRYEKYGLQSDIEHIKFRQGLDNYRFDITEVGSGVAKHDRIRRLIPLFEQGRVYLPRTLHRTNYQGQVEDLVEIFLNQEFKAFPVPLHDDMLDALARIEEPDLPLTWPMNGPKINMDALMNQPGDY